MTCTKRATNRALLLAAALAAAAVGCQTTNVRSLPTMKDPGPTVVDFTSATPPSDGSSAIVGKVSANEAVASDASATRLHDMEGPMLLYYALHKRLPDALEQLRPFADADTDLQLNAPSGKRYVYVPSGLVSMGTSKRIIVADPAPGANGKRWCILMPPPPERAGGALSMEVIAVPEQAFREFVPAD